MGRKRCSAVTAGVMEAGTTSAAVAGTRTTRALAAVTGVAFLSASMMLVGAATALKLCLLGLFVIAATLHAVLTGALVVYPRLIAFYFTVAVAGALAAIVGLLNAGAIPTAAVEGARVYSAWSLLFIIIFTLLRSAGSLRIVHTALVVGGIAIIQLS